MCPGIETESNTGHLKTNRSDAYLTLGLGRTVLLMSNQDWNSSSDFRRSFVKNERTWVWGPTFAALRALKCVYRSRIGWFWRIVFFLGGSSLTTARYLLWFQGRSAFVVVYCGTLCPKLLRDRQTVFPRKASFLLLLSASLLGVLQAVLLTFPPYKPVACHQVNFAWPRD